MFVSHEKSELDTVHNTGLLLFIVGEMQDVLASVHNNYRPIALASVVSKVFEMSLRVKLESFLHSSDYQFGFKANHSTDLCIYTLKEVIDFYKSQSPSIYVRSDICVFYGCV